MRASVAGGDTNFGSVVTARRNALEQPRKIDGTAFRRCPASEVTT
jgi:hypothetical protein